MPNEPFRDRQIGRLDAETLSPAGERLGYYPHYAPPGLHSRSAQLLTQPFAWLLGRQRFSVITTYNADGQREDHLLGRMMEPLEAPKTRIVEVLVGKQAYLIAPVPGTATADDLWLIMQPDGRFAAPPGVIGLQPINWKDSKIDAAEALGGSCRREVASWLVRYAQPGEPGHDPQAGATQPWGWCDGDFSKMSGPIWSQAVVASKNPLQPEAQEWLLIQSRGVWEAYYAVNAVHFTPDRRVAMGNTQAQTLQAAEAAEEVRIKARLAADQARARELEIYKAKLQLESDWESAVRDRNEAAMGRLVWSKGGDHWYDYAVRVANPSPTLLRQAADHVKDPVKAADLRARADRRATEATAAFANYVQARYAPAPSPYQGGSGAFAMPSQSMQFSNPQIYHYRAQTYGSFKPMPWDP